MTKQSRKLGTVNSNARHVRIEAVHKSPIIVNFEGPKRAKRMENRRRTLLVSYPTIVWTVCVSVSFSLTSIGAANEARCRLYGSPRRHP